MVGRWRPTPLPLGRALARRFREAQQQAGVAAGALDASQTERRLIAADLHDGVVQDLVGASYTLEAEAQRVDGHADEQVGEALRHGAATTRDSARALRSLLVDIYPAALYQAGLGAALRDLARTYTARGIETSVEAEDGLVIDDATERLLFRGAQEAMRNVHKHAGARTAEIVLRPTGRWIRLQVRDDGCGCGAGAVERRFREGHSGSGSWTTWSRTPGRLEVAPAPQGGTVVSVSLARLAHPAGVA